MFLSFFGIAQTTEDPPPNTPKPLYSGFKLPIQYLDTSRIHTLPDVVASDLEIDTMYDRLFQPPSSFAKLLIAEHRRTFTSDPAFLRDTQTVIRSAEQIDHPLSAEDCEYFQTMWTDVKEDAYFLEKYSYLDWSVLEHLNQSSEFLQTVSLANLISPVTSFLLPFVFFVLPFFLLKMRGIDISVDDYLDALREVAKHHFIGKMLNVRSFSLENLVYSFVLICLYFYQLYQNTVSCSRFYRNVRRMNEHLHYTRTFTARVSAHISQFRNLHGHLDTYRPFCVDLARHQCVLDSIQRDLADVSEFCITPGKLGQIGYMLKCFYALHKNAEYESSLRFAVGFEGYLQNLRGIAERLRSGDLALAEFSTNQSLQMEKQWYCGHNKEDSVQNDCDLTRNMIVTGVNASGKTTFLKTTTINVLFTQQFGCGYYSKCVLTPYTHIHSYLNIPDTSGRDSLFQAEARRCKDILDTIMLAGNDAHHFCIFDELYSGTNPDEAVRAASAFLRYLATKCPNVEFLLTTHYTKVCRKMRRLPNICNYQMEVEDTNGEMKYTYRILPGISHIRGGYEVLRGMGYPDEILAMMRHKGTSISTAKNGHVDSEKRKLAEKGARGIDGDVDASDDSHRSFVCPPTL